VGGERPTRVDVRIVAATNRDLRELVATGGFRRDLYYRLNVLRITLPPLRERRDDIPLLVERFIEEISGDNDRPFAGITDEAMEILRSHHWPGNVRELRNLIESMVVLAHGRMVGPEDIPAEVRSGRRDLLPVPIPRTDEEGGGQSLRPQLEFIFRTLVELRVDMDELKQEFEAYRRDLRSVERGRGEVGVLPRPEERPELRIGPEDLSMVEVLELAERPDGGPRTDPDDQGTVVYRPGMTMEDLEREAITAALREVEGNRRKAAERLGIGERTLYRKIKKFGLEE
jgi:DNA-binding NtrC family response regulator